MGGDVKLGYTREGGLPRWTDGEGAGGIWKEVPEDFQVEELPSEAPTGAGEHQWLRVEKVGRTTLDVVRALARHAGVPDAAIGYAGMKDRYARTVQEFTIHFGAEVPDIPGPDMRVVARGRTARRLRVGHLAGNRFTLRIRGGDAAVAAERLGRLRDTGMPNYYGVQRVGAEAPSQGRAILAGSGPRLRFDQLKFALSAYQSLLFNRVLVARGNRRLNGDLLAGDIPTGPMYGSRMPWPADEARALEESILTAEALPPGAWERFGKLTQGTRRALWIPVEADVAPVEDGFVLRFDLPAGSYATVLLEEIL
jgi:tRNA pseudouridine13 synthase